MINNKFKMIHLSLENVSVSYGAVLVLDNISFTAAKGEIIALLGGNGAGKTSLLHAISGIVKPRTGKIMFKNDRVSGLETVDIVRKGMLLVPQENAVFPGLTVKENIRIGKILALRTCSKSSLNSRIESILSFFPILKERMSVLAGQLSGGEQKMLSIGRVLLADPEILILDEPTLGLSRDVISILLKAIKQINSNKNTTMIIAEQKTEIALKIAHKAVVLQNGEIVFNGDSKKLLSNPETLYEYLSGQTYR